MSLVRVFTDLACVALLCCWVPWGGVSASRGGQVSCSRPRSGAASSTPSLLGF